jgi:hypothetical protein
VKYFDAHGFTNAPQGVSYSAKPVVSSVVVAGSLFGDPLFAERYAGENPQPAHSNQRLAPDANAYPFR